MVLVKITEIKSTPNPDTGKDGKQIQFSEFRQMVHKFTNVFS